jgi:hypothetical protein
VIIPGNDGTPVSITHKNGKPVVFAYHGLWAESLDTARDPTFQDEFDLFPKPQVDSQNRRVWSTWVSGLLFKAFHF